MEEELFNGATSKYFEGYVNKSNGKVGDLSQYYRSTDYLSVNDGDIIIFPMKFPTSLGACYDENKQYILGINSSELDENLKYTINPGVKFIRVSIEIGRVNNNISNYILYVIHKTNETINEDQVKDECENICERLNSLEKRIEIIIITEDNYNKLLDSGLLEDKLYFIV